MFPLIIQQDSAYIDQRNWTEHRWITYLVPSTTSPDAADVTSGRDTADGRGVGKLFLAEVPMGVDVAIGNPPGVWLTADCCGVIPDKRGLFTRPLVSTLDRGTSDSLSRKLTNNSEKDWKQATV